MLYALPENGILPTLRHLPTEGGLQNLKLQNKTPFLVGKLKMALLYFKSGSLGFTQTLILVY